MCRLHHDQQTAHALESAAAAYSNYPMSGKGKEKSQHLYDLVEINKTPKSC